MKQCKVCGKNIAKRNKNYCSRKCFSVSRIGISCRKETRIKISKSKTGKTTKRKYPARVSKICQYCGKLFSIWPSKEKQGKGKYCSKNCHNLSMENKKKKGAWTKIKCLTCKKSVDVPIWRLKKYGKKYCSIKCYDKSKAKLTPEDRHFRKGTKYKKWREKALKMDNYTCQMCKQKGGELDVHHLLPYTDYKEHVISIGNGYTLCKKCHKLVHKEMRKKKWPITKKDI